MNPVASLLHGGAIVLCVFIGATGCTEDGVDPSDTDAASVPMDARGATDSEGPESGSGRSDVGLADVAVPDVVVPDVGSVDDGLLPPIDGTAPPTPDTGPIPPLDPECDLSGRWLVSQRYVAEAVSEKQGAHTWFYLDVRHEGANITVQRGLHCGYAVTPISALGGKVDCAQAWPSFLAKNSSTGRRGTFVKNGSACHLKFDPEYTPRGVTLPYYLDPAHALPTASQAAQGTAPGWEDWDGDGNPGVTLTVAGLASGKIYSAQRERTAFEGDVPLASAKFKVPITVRVENVVLGRNGPILLESPSSVSIDPAANYAWLARLADDQGRGSDADACLAVRALKSQLVPEGDL